MNKPFPKQILRILGWTLATIIGLPIIGYLLLLLINLQDSPLSPSVENLLNSKPPASIAANDNGYFAWVGIVGAEDQDPAIWGQRWFNEALAIDKEFRTSMSPRNFAIDKERRKPEPTIKGFPCEKIENCAFDFVEKDTDAARVILQNGHITLERGDKALAFPDYQEPWRADYSVASTISPHPNGWLALCATRFALAAKEGRHDDAINQIAREVAFHINQLRGSLAFVDKVLATHNLGARYRLLSQYIQRYPEPAKARIDKIAKIIVALPREVTSLQASLLLEERVVTTVLLATKTNKEFERELLGELGDIAGPYLAKPFFLVSVSANEFTGVMDLWIHADGLTDKAYRESIIYAQRYGAQEVASFNLRNPVGHLLLGVAYQNIFPYMLRRDDLLALRALVAFQVKLLQNSITDPAAITRAIAADKDLLTHPFYGTTPIFDKEKRVIRFANSGAFGGEELSLHI